MAKTKSRQVPQIEFDKAYGLIPSKSQSRFIGYVQTSEWVSDGKGNYSKERTVDKVAAKEREEAVSLYQSILHAAMGSVTGDYESRSDGSSLNSDPYDYDVLDKFTEANKAIGKKDAKQIKTYLLETRDIVLSNNQRDSIYNIAYRLALHFGLCN